MPQLDTSTWFTTIISMIMALFILFQSKITNHTFFLSPSHKDTKLITHSTPWEKKWTKIYLPLSLPQH
uniref:ATP synthase complex subunit 8 n=1 Tax=Hadrosciurus spadiceus TaxID=511841 RepID=A0A7D5F3A2_9SCIU|nr:ATP synthase F0 subunit 8 [Hadrosciurus spadiceus]QLD22246.1 ATP synthase F0 subunit 8 [Hadrosciurus spadiceus]QLD22272.1 ATP synthase F0 subunit 8 [Hadrosciurus spadiceus]QLD22285.1 ATP synthase F0 subunit 8 [Hadrosciurus spadiceus]QLD22298.1 ATP synthase F0 subunit 8 [Hadrosciurus spadiceus]QLD22337.1 ATP synthase F0 subunit 8 [Hadrosciurus spadiceus]